MTKLKTTRRERKLLWATKDPTALGLCIREFAKLSNQEKQKDIEEIYAYCSPYNTSDLFETYDKVTCPPHLNEPLFIGLEHLYSQDEVIHQNLVKKHKHIMEDLILRTYKYFRKKGYEINDKKSASKDVPNEYEVTCQHNVNYIGYKRQRNKIQYNGSNFTGSTIEQGLMENRGQHGYYSFSDYLILAHYLTSEKIRKEFENPYYADLIRTMDKRMSNFTSLTEKRKYSFDAMTKTEPDLLKELRALRKIVTRNKAKTENIVYKTSNEVKAKSLIHNLKNEKDTILTRAEFFISSAQGRYGAEDTDVYMETNKTWVIKTNGKGSIKITYEPNSYRTRVNIKEACRELTNADPNHVNFADNVPSEVKLIIKAVLLKDKEAA